MDPLTSASRAEMLAALTRRYQEHLRPGERFELTTEETPRGVRALLTLQGGADQTRTELEVRVDFKKTNTASEDALGLALDALDLSLGEYLEEGRSERLNAAFMEREYEGRPIAFRGRVRRPALEAEASRLLGEPDEDEWT